ncbi:MAG: transporter [Firmicutes bacterium]|nr:transporter [Bacillota bacterium]
MVQHISTFTQYRQSKDWIYTFSQEWPVPDETHQLSFTLPWQRMEVSLDGKRAVGDVLLNYRYQLLGNGEAKVAIAPRFSLILPTGDEKQLRGNGALGYQVCLPISIVLSESLVAHSNVGATYTPNAKNALGHRASISAWNLGQSFVWLAHPNANALVEFVYSSGEIVTGPRLKDRVNTFFINPGLRCALNFENGLQIVPGIAMPIGVGPSKGERAIFLYLSFEHPMWRVKK